MAKMNKLLFEFRAKNIDTEDKEWKYGGYCYDVNNKDHKLVTYGESSVISQLTDALYNDGANNKLLSQRTYIVNPKTLGMHIRIKDNDNAKIFTGDIVRVWGGEYCQGSWEHDFTIKVEIGGHCLMFLEESENRKIIGNATDNPELLKECVRR